MMVKYGFLYSNDIAMVKNERLSPRLSKLPLKVWLKMYSNDEIRV